MSSSSDSDSDDDFDQVRKIRINIRPKDDVSTKKTGNLDEIKASIQNWRPLGPPTHSSLCRRQSSLSSVSTSSFNVNTPYSAFGSISSNGCNSTNNNNDNNNDHIFVTPQFTPAQERPGSIRSSPSCSSLVNDFNNRSSFSSNFISRTSSPLAFMSHGDIVPIAIAIQETIEINFIGGQYNFIDPYDNRQKFTSRSFGNIKIAFSASYVRSLDGKSRTPLKLRILSTDNIMKYFATRLIKDLDSNNSSFQGNRFSLIATPTPPSNMTNITTQKSAINAIENDNQSELIGINHHIESKHSYKEPNNDNDHQKRFDQKNQYQSDRSKYILIGNENDYKCVDKEIINTNNNNFHPELDSPQNVISRTTSDMDFFDSGNSLTNQVTNSKIIELNMDVLYNQLKHLRDKSPNSRYYNIDVLRYQIRSFKSLEECPLKVSAYWKLAQDTIKLRIDFSHSLGSELKLERFRDISISVDLKSLLLNDIDLEVVTNNNSQNNSLNQYQTTAKVMQGINNLNDNIISIQSHNTISLTNNHINSNLQHPFSSANPSIRMFDESFMKRTTSTPPTTTTTNDLLLNEFDTITDMSSSTTTTSSSGLADMGHIGDSVCGSSDNGIRELMDSTGFLSFQPKAAWNNNSKQLSWKFENLLAFHKQQNESQQQKSHNINTLMAKIDFRHSINLAKRLAIKDWKPTPVIVKFAVVDSSLSKININVDSIGYKLSMLRKEIRAGKYDSEAYVII